MKETWALQTSCVTAALGLLFRSSFWGQSKILLNIEALFAFFFSFKRKHVCIISWTYHILVILWGFSGVFWFFVWDFGFFFFEMALHLLGVAKKHLRKRTCFWSYSGEGIDNFMCYRLWIIGLFKVYYPFKKIGYSNQELTILLNHFLL